MGIQLPPVPQITTSTSNHLTLHHRNRSLDSALQRIPEVDVTPSPECEPASTSILSAEVRSSCPVSSKSKTHKDELASLGSDDSGILCGSDSGSTDTNTTRESSVELLIAADNQVSDYGSDLDVRRCSVSAECEKVDAGPVVRNAELVNITTTNRITQVSVISEAPKPSTGLLRLLESKVFDVSMAMHYLFKSKEPGVQSYIANKMFNFEDGDVDFYLPQLVCMYIQMHDVAEVIHPYLIYR